MKEEKHKNQGFTLVELVVVVAILAILVGILAPQYTKYVEKSRRAADASNAKAIENTLRLALIDDEIQVPMSDRNDNYGVWVMICKNAESAPQGYREQNLNFDGNAVWCGADQGVIINGRTCSGNMKSDGNIKELEDILLEAGISSKNLCTRSSSNRDGWDWIIVEVGYNKNKQIFSKIYSGFKNENGSVNRPYTSNIDKWMYSNQ